MGSQEKTDEDGKGEDVCVCVRERETRRKEEATNR